MRYVILLALVGCGREPTAVHCGPMRDTVAVRSGVDTVALVIQPRCG